MAQDGLSGHPMGWGMPWGGWLGGPVGWPNARSLVPMAGPMPDPSSQWGAQCQTEKYYILRTRSLHPGVPPVGSDAWRGGLPRSPMPRGGARSGGGSSLGGLSGSDGVGDSSAELCMGKSGYKALLLHWPFSLINLIPEIKTKLAPYPTQQCRGKM